MGKSCCAVGCTNRYDKTSGISFYRLPKALERRSAWIAAIKRENWNPGSETWLCSLHFISGKKHDDPLHPDYIPSVFSFKSTTNFKAANSLHRYERTRNLANKRKDNKDRDIAAKALLQLSPESEEQTVETGTTTQTTPTPVACAEIQTNETCGDISGLEVKLKNTELDCQELRREKRELKEKVDACSLNIEDFDDNKVKFYTGLPNLATFMLVLSFVSADLHKCGKHALTRSQQLLMTLMKLRLNPPEEDLAYRFGVHQSTVSRIFRKWIDILSVCLEPLIMWPNREDLGTSMPMSFRTFFSKCVAIIDCFEVFVERPSDLKARAQTWSNYKQHNTVKFLISITPQGTVSFVSKGWGGRVTDKHLTEHCGFLHKLLPGDLVLADRGFTIEDSVGFYCAEVVLPPFTRGKKQLSKKEVERAREISHVRIHVERVIGMLRQKYTILESTLPLSLIRVDQSSQEDKSIIDKIVVTCSALCNLCKSVVPSE